MQVEGTGEHNRITRGTLMLLRDPNKLIWFFGYPQLAPESELIELYDMSTDPQELHNLAAAKPGLATDLLTAAKAKLAAMDQPG